MKRYILFGLSLLMAFPLCVSAQTEDDAVASVKKVVSRQKKYDTKAVKGQVLDAATGKPISGAIVKANEINGYSTLTDENGKYEVNVPTFATALYISAPDYNSVVLGISENAEQKVARLLTSDFKAEYSAELNENGDKTANNFKYSNAITIKEEVQKQLGAYARYTSYNGTPGVGGTMFIQGLNSINANAQPLVVVDGVVLEQQYDRTMLHGGFYNDVLSNINPADIANVTVMRNGTALYGARGANGVILVETRRNSSMATRITASLSAGFTFMPKFIDMMGAEEYRNYASEMLKGTGTQISQFKFLNSDPLYYYYKQYHNNTDWKEGVYRMDNGFALTQNYGVNIDGGDDVAKYNLSLGYTSAESPLQYNDLDRLNIRFNTDIQLFNNLDVRFDASFSNTTRNIRDDGAPSQYAEGTPTSPSFLAYAKAPFLSPYSYGHGKLSDSYLEITDETYLDEALANYSGYNYKLGNPWALNEYADAPNKNHFETSLLNLSITPRFEITPNLAISEHFSYTLVNTNEKYYIPINGVPSFYVASVSAARENFVQSFATKQNSVQSDTRLTWKNRYDAHSIRAFAGVRLNFENYTNGTLGGYNTGSDKTPFISNGLLNGQATGIDESWRTMDVYAQANYNFKNRYYLQANVTGTGSSRFGRDAKGGLKAGGVVWGIFPGVQASWVLTNEKWLANVPGLDYLRVTAGYDISGNDAIANDAARSYFRPNLYLNEVSGLTFGNIGNTEIKWETTRRFNTGIEANFLNNRLHAEFNYFTSTTSDLLSLQALNFLTGMESNWANSGKLENHGYDAAVSGKIIANRNWKWELGASVGHYKNKIVELAEGKQYIDADVYNATIRTQVGRPANLFYGYKTKGVYATTDEATADGKYVLDANGVDHINFGGGDINFVDKDGNGEINDKDRDIIGDPNPDIYGNIFTSIAYKRFRLDVNFNYSLGNDVYNYMRSQLESGSRFMNQTTAMNNRWKTEGQVTNMPKATFQDPMGNSRFSDRWIEDGSYLRLKTVTLSYDLPLNSQYIQGLSVWVQCNNLFTLTKYLGSDPEFNVTPSVIGQGIDFGRLGQSRSIVAGVKVNL